jgi:small-conductance mechanosensitive channel
VIPNADLFTHSVIINTALTTRRWEYDLNLKGIQDLSEIKSHIIETVRKVPGVLPEPSPEALVTDLTDPDSGTLKVRVLWWTKAPRHHEMLASYDDVLSAIGQALNHVKIDNKRAA